MPAFLAPLAPIPCCQGLPTSPLLTLRSCIVSSAMRPLLGMPMRRVSRSASFAGFATASRAHTRLIQTPRPVEGEAQRAQGSQVLWHLAWHGRQAEAQESQGCYCPHSSFPARSQQHEASLSSMNTPTAPAVLLRLHVTSCCGRAAARCGCVLLKALLNCCRRDRPPKAATGCAQLRCRVPLSMSACPGLLWAVRPTDNATMLKLAMPEGRSSRKWKIPNGREK